MQNTSNSQPSYEEILLAAKAKAQQITMLVNIIKKLDEDFNSDWDLVDYKTEQTGKMVPQRTWNDASRKMEDVIDPETGKVQMIPEVETKKEFIPDEELNLDARAKKQAYKSVRELLLTLLR